MRRVSTTDEEWAGATVEDEAISSSALRTADAGESSAL